MHDVRLNYEVSVPYQPFLSPFLLQMKQQRSSTCVKTLLVMKQGDDQSLLLFKLFMDDYQRTMNVTVFRGLAKLFLDHFILLARPLFDRKRLLTWAWADKVEMEWASH